jgi:hypothetical protein
MSTERWQEFLSQVPLEPSFQPVPPLAVDVLDVYEQGSGVQLPRSYREFMLRLGPGELGFPPGGEGEEYQIVAPPSPGSNAGADLTALTHEYHSASGLEQRADEDLGQEYGDAGRVRRLILFASTFGGDRYGWDPEDVRDPEGPEFGIYRVPHGGPLEYAAASFSEFVLSTQAERFVPEPDRRLLAPADELEGLERYDTQSPEYQEILAFARDGGLAQSEFPDEEGFVIHILETQEWNPDDELVARFLAWREAGQ